MNVAVIRFELSRLSILTCLNYLLSSVFRWNLRRVMLRRLGHRCRMCSFLLLFLSGCLGRWLACVLIYVMLCAFFAHHGLSICTGI